MSVSGFLEEMRSRSLERVAALLPQQQEICELGRRARFSQRPHRLKEALSKRGVGVIAEIKKASPSAGTLRFDFSPAAIAAAYTANGAVAISVITEESRFGGRLEHLKQAREVTSLPLLRKDFISHPVQVFEAAASGADAVLLIVAMLDDQSLGDLLAVARELGLDALVEVHRRAELERALAAGADLVGINNRCLNTLQVSLDNSVTLSRLVPRHVALICESGLQTPNDLRRMRALGFDGALIGEAFMRAADPGGTLRGLLEEATRVQTKICGITSVDDAFAAVEGGADLLGLNFYSQSPRFISINTATSIVRSVCDRAVIIGVFANATADYVRRIATETGITKVQLHGKNAFDLRGQLTGLDSIVAVSTDDPVNLGTDRNRSVLVDASTPLLGGSGRLADWSWAAAIRQQVPELFLAGGLDAGNVQRAIEAVSPDVVDACSRLESSPGAKDHGKVRAFIASVRAGRSGVPTYV